MQPVTIMEFRSKCSVSMLLPVSAALLTLLGGSFAILQEEGWSQAVNDNIYCVQFLTFRYL